MCPEVVGDQGAAASYLVSDRGPARSRADTRSTTMRTPKARASRKPDSPMTGRASGAEDVSGAVAALYAEHYRPLVRLAVLLVSDLASAEEIVQEAFAGLHGTWRTLPGPDAGLRYLRRSLIRRS